MSKRTVITGPEGQVTTITEQKRGCLWWTVTVFLVFIVVGGAVAALPLIWPLLLFVAVCAGIFLLLGGLGKLGYGTTRPPLRKGRRGQPRWSVTQKWWWDGEKWIDPGHWDGEKWVKPGGAA